MDAILRLLPAANDSITSSDLMAALGYPTEAHYATTEDGYRLRLDRVANPGRQPVYLAHGMQTASPAFALLGRGKALAGLLHDAGYDVWMVNYRGTHYSQHHDKLSVYDDRFWRFSVHEHGALDNPAAIDLVLRQTGFPSVLYVGHSMGSTSLLVMASQRPEYQAKVQAAFLMAPAARLHHHRSSFLRLLRAVYNMTEPLADSLGLHRLMRPTYLLMRRFAKLVPKTLMPLFYSFTFTIVGTNPEAAYYDLPFFFDTIPSGGSWGEIIFYGQNADSRRNGFRQYDHGVKKNRKLYGSPEPPEYDLTSIRTPVFMYLSDNDPLCARGDTDFLQAQLENVVRVHHAKSPEFNHMDFFASPAALDEVYYTLLSDVQEVASNRTKNGPTTSPGLVQSGSDSQRREGNCGGLETPCASLNTLCL